jgi:hypothetical protein
VIYLIIVYKRYINYVNWWWRVVLERLTVAQLIKNFLAIYAIQKITIFTRAQKWKLCSPNWIQVTLYFFKIYLNIIFWFMQSFPSVAFLSCFLSRILYTFLISPVHATCCPIHFIVITLVLLYKTSLSKILLELLMDITASVGIQHTASTECWTESPIQFKSIQVLC